MDGVQTNGPLPDRRDERREESHEIRVGTDASAPCCSLAPEDTGELSLRRSIPGTATTCLCTFMHLLLGAVSFYSLSQGRRFIFPTLLVCVLSLVVGVFRLTALESVVQHRRLTALVLGVASAVLLPLGAIAYHRKEDEDGVVTAVGLAILIVLFQLPVYLCHPAHGGDCCCCWFCSPSYLADEEGAGPVEELSLAGDEAGRVGDWEEPEGASD